MDKSWRPKGQWDASKIVADEAARLIKFGYEGGWADFVEAGASAIIPYVEAETARKYEKRIKELQETCAQWKRLTAEVGKQARKEVGEWLFQIIRDNLNTYERDEMLRTIGKISIGITHFRNGEMPGKEVV